MRSTATRYGLLVESGRRGRWVGVLLLGLAVSLIEAIGAGLVYLLISLATGDEASADLPFVGDVGDLLPDTTSDELVVTVAIGVAVFFLLRAAVVVLQRYVQTRVVQLAGVDLSVRLLERYLHLPYSFHLQRNSATLMRNVKDAVAEILGSVLMPAIRLVSESLVVVAVMSVLVLTAPGATAIVALVLGPLVFVALRLVKPRIKHLGWVSQLEGARSYQALQQSLHGFREITVLGRQGFFIEVFRSSQLTIAETRYKRAVLAELPRVSIEAVVIAFIAGFVAVSTLAADDASQSLAVIGLFGYASLRVMPALNKMVSALNAMRFGAAALGAVEDDLKLPVLPVEGGGDRLPFRDAIRVERMSFRYDGAEKSTLRDIDLTIARGESVGIVGSTGAGKSTLVDLLVGLSVPTTGAVTVDGVDLSGHAASWQRNIGLVSQSVFLLDDTLRRNIALGVADEEIDDEQVLAAARLAQLEDFVASLPDGLETLVGERGARVSGGQRQRIAIARALYPRPSVLVFDEGTSALDNLTEARLIEALAMLRADHTIITVAHRLSTVQDYDRIVFMRDGTIDDVGSFEELVHRNENFRRLARWTEAGQADQR